MKNFEIEKESYLRITCTNGFIVEGFVYNDLWIEWWLYNVAYGIKQHLFTIEKDFNIKKYLKNNYFELCDDYLERFGDYNENNYFIHAFTTNIYLAFNRIISLIAT